MLWEQRAQTVQCRRAWRKPCFQISLVLYSHCWDGVNIVGNHHRWWRAAGRPAIRKGSKSSDHVETTPSWPRASQVLLDPLHNDNKNDVYWTFHHLFSFQRYQNSFYLEQCFLTFLMLKLFNTGPYVMVTPTMKLFFLLLPVILLLLWTVMLITVFSDGLRWPPWKGHSDW